MYNVEIDFPLRVCMHVYFLDMGDFFVSSAGKVLEVLFKNTACVEAIRARVMQGLVDCLKGNFRLLMISRTLLRLRQALTEA